MECSWGLLIQIFRSRRGVSTNHVIGGFSDTNVEMHVRTVLWTTLVHYCISFELCISFHLIVPDNRMHSLGLDYSTPARRPDFPKYFTSRAK
jgi:hypothetical protein